MKMASGGPAGGTHAGDHVAALHLLAFTDQNLGKMPIARFNAPAMGKVDHVAIAAAPRSEEHTSELQSLMRISYAVFCLKKKMKAKNTAPSNTISTTVHDK